MDISVILTTLGAGIAAVSQDTCKQAVKDAYEALKERIKKRFAEKKNSNGELALKEHETDPDTWEKPLQKALIESEADKDDNIIKAVQALTEALRSTSVPGKYNITGSEVGVIGDHTVVSGGIHIGGKK